MARPLLPIVPLLMASSPAQPPVPSQRVTGNVSTEHHERRTQRTAKPVTDACRVTGNVMRVASKSAENLDNCQVLVDGRRITYGMAWFTTSEDGRTCSAEGQWVQVKEERMCRLQPQEPPTDRSAVDVPAHFATVVPPKAGS
ncbi:MAG: hypothetical protein KTR31_31095 [Myxococcales bacterium]|nr:hypothetical protein [Myxococcales bacterium]